ncbi:MAG: FG-GAP-like repeat-containing protein [bacterium]|nr:FG-GAP-like repeat-containing protein [bacterium]
MRFFFRLFIVLLTISFSSPSWALVTQINFVGPKIENQFTIQPAGAGPVTVPIFFPGDFDTQKFMGGDDLLDAVVPSNIMDILGAKNLNQWLQAGPNVFWDIEYVYHSDRVGLYLQAVLGEFNGNATQDVVIVPFGMPLIYICYDFTGNSCSSWGWFPLFEDPANSQKPLLPIAARTGDLNQDGHDDVALVTWNPEDAWQTEFVFLAGNDTGGNTAFNPYDPVKMQKLHGWSISLGDANKDGKLDVAIGSMRHGQLTGVLSVLTNNGNPGPNSFDYDNTKDQSFGECGWPTGLESYDDNGDGHSDQVMTCALRDDAGTPIGGPVLLLENNGGTGHAYTVKQTLTDPALYGGGKGLNIPTRTAIGDFNEDGKSDLAVAEHGGYTVIVYEGTGPFQVNADTRRKMPSAPYPCAYIQIHDFNNDGKQDIICTARGPIQRSTGLQTSAAVTRYPGVSGTFCVDPETITNVPLDAEIVVDWRTLQQVNYSGLGASGLVSSELTADGYTLKVDSQAAGLANVQVGAFVATGEATFDGEVYNLKAADIRPCDGILVWLNFQPDVTFGNVDCDAEEIEFQCVKTGGNDIVSCDASSPDFAVQLTQTPNAGNNWTGKIKVPADKKNFKIIVVAKNDVDATYTAELQVNIEACPTGSNCPEKPVKSQVWPNQPFSLCVPEAQAKSAQLGGASITWKQTSGPDILTPGPGKGFSYKNIGVSGPCITGSFGIVDNQAFIKEDFGFVYRIDYGKGQVMECPADLQKLAAMVEGSGTCSLQRNPVSTAPAKHLALILMILAVPALGLRLRRN